VQQVVTYTISDGNGGTATATLTIDVNGVNDAPVVLAPVPPQGGLEGSPVSIDVSNLFDDVDTGDVLTFTATGLPPGLSIDPASGLISGTIAFNAAAGGPYSVTVQVSDGHGGTATTTFVWNVNAETVADTPKPYSPLVLPSLEKTVDLNSSHPILDTVNGLAPLRGTPDFDDLIITRTIDDLSSLNSAIDIERGDGMIERLVAWAGRQGRQSSWIYELFEKMDREPYAGDSLDLALGLDGTDLFSIKTVLHNGALYIGVDELTDAGDVVDISVVAGGGGVARMGAQDVILNVLPGDGWIDLKIVGQTKDGRRVTWAVTVNAHSGEVLGVKTKAGLPKLANVILRGDAGHAPPIVSGFGAAG
jgi:Putative Ig domain